MNQWGQIASEKKVNESDTSSQFNKAREDIKALIFLSAVSSQ